MEPISAVGLASNILQLIEISWKVTSTAREIYKSTKGLSTEVERSRSEAIRVRENLDIFKKANTGNFDLQKLVQPFYDQINDYVVHIDDLRNNRKTRFGAAIAAGRTIFGSDDLAEKRQTFTEAGSTLVSHLVMVYLPRIDSKLDAMDVRQEASEAELRKDMARLMAQVNGSRNQYDNSQNRLLQSLETWLSERDILHARQSFLKSLCYSRMRHRRDDMIRNPHQGTFTWLLDGIETDRRGDTRLRDWLKASDPCCNTFWVSGKAGSGKSTLMKSIETHLALDDLLHEWVDGKKLIKATYYFWNAGSSLQRSVEGLVRSLLYQSFLQHPELLNLIFPDNDPEWSMVGTEHGFTVAQLYKALERMMFQGERLQLRFFFIIDGLDEIDHREQKNGQQNSGSDLKGQRELIEFINAFREYSIVKLCISSRPWNIFKQEYGQDTNLCLQLHEVTRNDIEVYTRGMLEKDLAFREILARDQNNEYDQLVNEILDAAHGVFLWVQLALHNLLAGATDGDGFYELQGKLRALPRELDDMYNHIFSTVEAEYKEHAARYLLMAAFNTRKDLALMVYMYSDEQEYSKCVSKRTFEVDEYLYAQSLMIKRINAYCKGLLEVAVNDVPDTAMDQTGNALHGSLYTVARLYHRSVVDWVKTTDPDKGFSKLNYGSIDIHAAMARGQVAQMHATVLAFREYYHDLMSAKHKEASLVTLNFPFSWMIAWFPIFDHRVSELRRDVSFAFWDELERVCCTRVVPSWQPIPDLFLRWACVADRYDPISFPGSFSFLDIELYSGAAEYVDHRLRMMSHHDRQVLLSGENNAVFTAAMCTYISSRRATLLNILFNHGANPNQAHGPITPWTAFLSKGLQIAYQSRNFRYFYTEQATRDEEKQGIETFIRHGADCNASCEMYVYALQGASNRDESSEEQLHLHGTSIMAWVQRFGEISWAKKFAVPCATSIEYICMEAGITIECASLDMPKATETLDDIVARVVEGVREQRKSHPHQLS